MKSIYVIIGLFLITSFTCSNRGSENLKGLQIQEDLSNQLLGSNLQDVLCEAFLYGFDEVKLYNEINGETIGTVQNDNEREIFYSVEIFEKKEDWFKIRVEARGDTIAGWIKNNSYLATYSRNYTDTLFVYKSPDFKNIQCVFAEYFTTPMLIVDCKKDWVRVEISNNESTCQGWVPQSMTCSSPYTTCP